MPSKDEKMTKTIANRRKRIHDSVSHKRKLNKRKRLAGVEYVGFSTKNEKIKQDQLRGARQMGPCCSSIRCAKSKARHCSRFDESIRSAIFKSFWELPHWSAKQVFVQSLVKSMNVKVSRIRESRRKKTYEYYLYLNGTALQVLFSTQASIFDVELKFSSSSGL